MYLLIPFIDINNHIIMIGYHAPLDVFGELQQRALDRQLEANVPPDTPVNVCIGKEWYRFPSNFFMPDDRFDIMIVYNVHCHLPVNLYG